MIALKPGMRRVRNLSSARPVRRGDCACAQFCCRGIGNGDSSHRRLRLSKFSPPGPFFIRACALISKRAWRWCTSERKRGGDIRVQIVFLSQHSGRKKARRRSWDFASKEFRQSTAKNPTPAFDGGQLRRRLHVTKEMRHSRQFGLKLQCLAMATGQLQRRLTRRRQAKRRRAQNGGRSRRRTAGPGNALQ